MRWIAILPATLFVAVFLYWLVLWVLSEVMGWLPRGPWRDAIGMLWGWAAPPLLGWLVFLLIWTALLLLARAIVKSRGNADRAR